MKRKLSLSTIINAVGFIRYLPAIIFQIKNWLNFILHYLNIDKGASEYIFRNGIKIKTKDAVSSATIAVIFIKKDYGDVPDNSIVIDIGANIGVYSIFSAIGKKTTIFAYEPMLDNFNLLKENIKLNQLENRIFPFNVAVSAKKEKRKLYLGESPLHSFLPKDESPFNAMFGHSEENQ
ncbi:MAG: FkbM family methyltransferase, partial [Candidatus Gracilibacteria bacterium]